MNPKSLLTGALLILAVGGMIYVLAGGEETAQETGANPAGNPGQAEEPATGDQAAVAENTARDDLPSDGVVVYYFHGRQRCYTCNKMETLADSVVFERFANYLRDGWVVFKSVNVQAPENGHFAQDYELRSAGVVMVEREQGQNVRWRRLDEVWMKIRNDDEYKTYIAENLTECLRAVGLEKS